MDWAPAHRRVSASSAVWLWLLGRITLLWSAETGLALAFALDVGFYFVFGFMAGREVLGAKNRNLPMVLLVLLFGGANGLDYAGTTRVIADADSQDCSSSAA